MNKIPDDTTKLADALRRAVLRGDVTPSVANATKLRGGMTGILNQKFRGLLIEGQTS